MSGCDCQSKLLSSIEKHIGGNYLLRLHFDLDNPVVPNLTGDQVFRNKVQRWYLIPWGFHAVQDRFGFVTILYDLDFPGAVIDEGG